MWCHVTDDAQADTAAWQTIRVEVKASLGLITLNRPDLRNPLDQLGARELLRALDLLFEDGRVRSIAITGAGSAFCAGGNLNQMKNLTKIGTEAAFNWPAPIIALNQRMLTAPKPVIAAVNGPAYAGGLGLAGMCDIVLAVERARFATPEVKVGNFPMIIVAYLAQGLPRKVLMEMMFTGDPISADEAKQLGFVNRVYADVDAMHEGLQDYARRLAKASPDALRLGRRTFALLSEMSPDRALDAAQFMLMPFHLGADVAEGADAFLEKRKPSWEPEVD